jgi:acetoin utilization protein AcuB
VLAGVLSERDVYAAAANHGVPVAWNMRAGEVMHTELQTVAPSDPIGVAAKRMASSKVGCLPVLADGELVGIVTTIDVLRERSVERRGTRETS